MRPIKRRKFLEVAALGVLGIAWRPFDFRFGNSSKKPNIIYIMSDDLGYGDLECYGQKRIKTPNIDKLAAEGMKFMDYYAGSTVCAPSRCSLMTGYDTGHTFVRGNMNVGFTSQIPIPDSTKTVAEYLKQAGYRTGLIGKWGLGSNENSGDPNKQGFDYFYGYYDQRHAHNYYTEYLFKNGKKIRLKGNKMAHPRPDGEGIAEEKVTYTPDLFTEECLQFIERNKDKPFFLYFAETIPHANDRGGDNGMDLGMEVPDLGIYKDRNWPFAEKGKAAMITRMDRDVGRIMAKLKELGIDDNTIVIFTSDNGPHAEGGVHPEFFNSGGPLRGIKRDVYEGGIRVPMIARWPGKIKPNTVSDLACAGWDFLPTACNIAGVQAPNGIDGISFLPEMLGKDKQQPNHKYLYWEFFGPIFKRALRMGKYKLVQVGINSSFELYDLQNDIGETKNIADQHPDIVEKMETIMKNARTESKYWKMPPTNKK